MKEIRYNFTEEELRQICRGDIVTLAIDEEIFPGAPVVKVALLDIGRGPIATNLAYGDRLRMADGSTKMVQNIRPGDLLAGSGGPVAVASIDTGAPLEIKETIYTTDELIQLLLLRIYRSPSTDANVREAADRLKKRLDANPRAVVVGSAVIVALVFGLMLHFAGGVSVHVWPFYVLVALFAAEARFCYWLGSGK